jgi:hypothetical protein
MRGLRLLLSSFKARKCSRLTMTIACAEILRAILYGSAIAAAVIDAYCGIRWQ